MSSVAANDHGILNQQKSLKRLLLTVVSRRGGLERAIPVLFRVTQRKKRCGERLIHAKGKQGDGKVKG